MVVCILIIITVAEDVAVRRRLRFQREVNRTCSTRRNAALQSTQVRISDRFIRGEGGELTPATFRQSLKTHLFSVYQYDSTFSAIRVSHVMRSINAQYLLTYCLFVSVRPTEEPALQHRRCPTSNHHSDNGKVVKTARFLTT